jgi:hypothetical protein
MILRPFQVSLPKSTPARGTVRLNKKAGANYPFPSAPTAAPGRSASPYEVS